MNRCLTEGRQALAVRVAGIEGGIECAKLAPLLSALADGEASAEDVAALRRARLKAVRVAPARVAALVPPAMLLAGDDGGPMRRLIETALGAAQHKAAVLGERAQTAAELVSAQKVAAVAASAAALAGGGTAVDRFTDHEGPPVPAAERVEAEPVKEETPVAPAPTEPVTREPVPASDPPAAAAPAPQPTPAPSPPPPPPPDPANEFAPGGSAPAASASPAPAAQPAPPAGGGFAPGGGGSAGGGGGSAGEFGP